MNPSLKIAPAAISFGISAIAMLTACASQDARSISADPTSSVEPAAEDLPPLSTRQEASAVLSSAPAPPVADTSSPNAPPQPTVAPKPSRPALVRAKSPLIVLGTRLPGRLDIRDGCIVVTMDGTASTAVFPPTARLVSEWGKPTAVTYPGRRLPLGTDTDIPGGGDASASDLAASPPAGCPARLFPIGG